MAAPKIPETPDFIRGLVNSADQIYQSLPHGNKSGRNLLRRLKDREIKLNNLSSEDRQLLGEYQARVVLMVLAAELALKFLSQQTNLKLPDNDHNLHDLFKGLKDSLKEEIEAKYSEYCSNQQPPKYSPERWETADQVFQLCNKASVQWRYLVEEKNFPDYAMQATYLKYATFSVLRVAEVLPQKHQ